MEVSVHDRETALQEAISSRNEAVQEHVSQELADQRTVIVTEAEAASAHERLRQSQIKSEYTVQLAQYQDNADSNLQQASATITGLRQELYMNEREKDKLQTQVQSMHLSR